jgi:hypothetical protein
MHKIVQGILWACCIFVISTTEAHDVVWPGNPTGFTPQEPLRVEFGASGTVEVKPVIGEPCIVAVNLDAVASTLVKVEVITENPAVQVNIRVTALRAATNASEVVIVSGEWHATGMPDPDECTAVMPNLFAVPIQVLGGPPAGTVSGITPAAATPGSTVVIEGTGLTGVTKVAFGGVQAEFVMLDDGTIRAVVPANAPVGKVSVTTGGGTIESAQLFVVQPELKVTPAMNGTMVQVEWDQRSYPFTLQRLTSLASGVWSDVITTLENSVSVLVEESSAFYRLSWMEIPLDTTDYNLGRASIAERYHHDPIEYWANFGVPALARLAAMRERVGLDPFAVFRGFLQGFDEMRFREALVRDDLPPPISVTLSNQLSAGLALTNAFVKTMITLVKTNDTTNCFTVISTNCFRTNTLAPVFSKVMTNWATTNTWSAWEPAGSKSLYSTNQLTNHPGFNWIDTHGTHGFTQERRPARPPINTNTTVKVKWEDITSESFTNTTYNGACASVAVGASLAKLGLIPDDTSAQFWNELSRLIGATPGTLGAYATDVAAFYKTLGYGAANAYDGPSESAVEEAKKALERGCDLAISYYSADGTLGHAEFVLGIEIDPNDSTKGTISTLSWGQHATVTYDGSISGGTYDGKSDGARYRKPGQSASWLEQTGTAYLRYYCKE